MKGESYLSGMEASCPQKVALKKASFISQLPNGSKSTQDGSWSVPLIDLCLFGRRAAAGFDLGMVPFKSVREEHLSVFIERDDVLDFGRAADHLEGLHADGVPSVEWLEVGDSLSNRALWDTWYCLFDGELAIGLIL